jgi:hypothetical protein
MDFLSSSELDAAPARKRFTLYRQHGHRQSNLSTHRALPGEAARRRRLRSPAPARLPDPLLSLRRAVPT